MPYQAVQIQSQFDGFISDESIGVLKTWRYKLCKEEESERDKKERERKQKEREYLHDFLDGESPCLKAGVLVQALQQLNPALGHLPRSTAHLDGFHQQGTNHAQPLQSVKIIIIILCNIQGSPQDGLGGVDPVPATVQAIGKNYNYVIFRVPSPQNGLGGVDPTQPLHEQVAS